MSYEGPERRRENLEYSEIRHKLDSVNTRLEVLITNMDILKEMKDKAHTEIHHILKMHDAEIFGRGGEEGIKQRIGKVSDVAKAINDHTIRDNWLFGIMITILLALIGGVFFK